MPGGGGGVLGLEKGTDGGPTAGPTMAKKGGAVLILYCRIGELSELVHLIFHIK